MALIELDLIGFLPDSIKQRLFGALIDFLVDQAEKVVSGQVADALKKLRSDADFRAAFEQALQRAVRRFVEQYAEVDREVLVALMRQPERFWEARPVREALSEMMRRPGTYLEPERRSLERSFAEILPRFEPERVNRAVGHFLSLLAEEVMVIPQLQPVYGVQLQKLTLDQGRAMVAALRDLQADQRHAIMALVEAVSSFPEFLDREQLAPPTRPHVYHNLPHRNYGRFVGRQEELDRIHQLLKPYPHSRYHIVTVDGIGGIGKSTLALEAAYYYLQQYETLPPEERFDAIIWASAKQSVLTADGIVSRRQTLRTLDDLYTTISTTLDREDITRARSDKQPSLVDQALRRQRTLLILDNFETVDDEQVLAFVREVPDPTKVIVTTRHRIDVAYPVRLVGMPEEDGLSLIAQECDEQAVTMTEKEARRLYERTGGVPLAIVWSLALMGYGYGVDAVLRRLGQRSEDIGHYCFAGALDLVRGTEAYILLMALSIFQTDACRDALGSVADMARTELDRDEGMVKLERLSLLNKHGDRFWMLPLTRSYVRELLAQKPELEAQLRNNWAEYYVQLLRRFEVGYEGAVDRTINDYRSVVIELENIFAVLEWCYSTQRWSQVATSVHLLSNLLYIRGLWAEREHWIELGQESARRCGDRLTEGLLLCDKAWVLSRQIEHAEAQAVLEEARAIAESIDSDLLLRYTLLVQGDSARRRKLFPLALECFNSARQGSGAALDRHLARIDYYVGQVYLGKEQLAEAKQKFQAVMERAQHLRWHRAIAHVYLELGEVALKDSDYELGWVMTYEKALPMLKEWEDEYELATCALLIGEIAENKGETAEAVLWTRKAKRVFEHQERKDKLAQAEEQLRGLGVTD